MLDLKTLISEIEQHLKNGTPFSIQISGNEKIFEQAIGQLLDSAGTPEGVKTLMELAKKLKLFQHKNRDKQASRVA